MADAGHSFGPDCAYYESEPIPATTYTTEPTPVRAQFFYVSLLPIDDPLSPVPSVQTDQSTNINPQPFSIRDNAALEEAWQKMQSKEDHRSRRIRPDSRGLTRMTSFPAFQSGLKSPGQHSPPAESSNSTHGTFTAMHQSQQSLTSINSQITASNETNAKSLKKTSPKLPRDPSVKSNTNRSRKPSETTVEEQVLLDSASIQQTSPEPLQAVETPLLDHTISGLQRKQASPRRRKRPQGRSSPESSISIDGTDSATIVNPTTPSQSTVNLSSDISGRPFARAPSSRQVAQISENDLYEPGSPQSKASRESVRNNSLDQDVTQREKYFVPVGISRLHLVQFPQMQMKPIYWNPVNDISNVIRATWFYKDTMLPVPADVANRLERGYEDLRPFAETYQDELNACVEHGAAAELKIVYKLWPEAKEQSPTRSVPDDKSAEAEIAREAAAAAAMPSIPINAAMDPRKSGTKRLFESYSVIYVNARDAQILRPNALPSVSRNRRPLNSIRKGRSLGIAVVRGFDRTLWRKLHPDTRFDTKAVQAKIGALMAQAGNETTRDVVSSCSKCDAEEAQSKVSDLVLVIHGIGQKLSERVDSYHFTHAINELRREFNVEMANESIRGSIDQDKGMMVLPVNWRLTLSFDEEQQTAENQYELKDITPESLPAVRSLISDVMLDIPYYMSHHKSKMTAAVIREANKVYRLWCRNNPGFENYGRVHLVAHSLGSVMAMEILSNQPTSVPPLLEFSSDSPNETIFEFNVTNLFCCGSPSGFFLLLNGVNLIPRRGRNKPGMEGEDSNLGLAGEQGKYGCLAVDNLYNICHRNDPIAYCQNACVDNTYAASLQPASIPSASQSLFGRIGSSLRWASNSTNNAYGRMPTSARPNMVHMPSTVELETHNFTREEIAEKRMFLLNDNGQIDYFLNSGGGPLEIQYLNMLSAHSSYWILQDFVRFLVVEIGRTPGREHTLPALRAVKKRQYKKSTPA